MAPLVRALDELLRRTHPAAVRVDRATLYLRTDTRTVQLLLGLYEAKGAVAPQESFFCPRCDDVPVEADEEKGSWYCDLCERSYDESTLRSETVYMIVAPQPNAPDHSERTDKSEAKTQMSTEVNQDRLFRITAWTRASIAPRDFAVNCEHFGDTEAQEVRGHLQRYGIAHLRMSGQSPDQSFVEAVARQVGQPCEWQNDFHGYVKTIRPSADGVANSASTTADLGLHVDGTQHEDHPAVLIFQYVAGAKYGADSVFVDGAQVLRDIEESRRDQLLTNLSNYYAASFDKKGMYLRAPVFSMAGPGAIKIRIRFDEVMSVHPDFKEDYEYLRERFNLPQYRISFKPQEGDIIVFDNWRLLHARDEVFGHPAREHRRMWISRLQPEFQSEIHLGIRPLPLETLLAVERGNKSVASES